MTPLGQYVLNFHSLRNNIAAVSKYHRWLTAMVLLLKEAFPISMYAGIFSTPYTSCLQTALVAPWTDITISMYVMLVPGYIQFVQKLYFSDVLTVRFVLRMHFLVEMMNIL